MPNATLFRDAEKYLSYLKAPLGRLRSDLTHRSLKGFLPDLAHPKRALDLGGGTGSMSVPLAKNGFSVALLDSSEEMLEIAQKQAEASGVATRISFHHADAAQVQELLAPETFDIIHLPQFAGVRGGPGRDRSQYRAHPAGGCGRITARTKSCGRCVKGCHPVV